MFPVAESETLWQGLSLYGNDTIHLGQAAAFIDSPIFDLASEASLDEIELKESLSAR